MEALPQFGLPHYHIRCVTLVIPAKLMMSHMSRPEQIEVHALHRIPKYRSALSQTWRDATAHCCMKGLMTSENHHLDCDNSNYPEYWSGQQETKRNYTNADPV